MDAPPIELVAPGRRRVTVVPRSADDHLGDLADALGLDPDQPLAVDGRPVGRHDTLARAGLLRGSRVAPCLSSAAGGLSDGTTLVTVVGEAGPGAGLAVPLAAGRHVVGRAAGAAVHLADTTLEPHHAVLDVSGDGTVVLTQLTGRVPCRVAGEPVAGPTVVVDGAVVTLGASRLRVGRMAGPSPGAVALAPSAGDPWRRAVHRPPRACPRWAPPPVPVPQAAPPSLRPPAAGLAAAGFTLLGSVAVAVVLRSPLFLVFGAVGLFAALGLWVAGLIRAGREGRRAGACRDREVAAFAAALAGQRAERWRHQVAAVPILAEAVAAATTTRGDLWCRRTGHGDAFTACIGWGPVTWAPELADHAGPLPPELLPLVESAARFEDGPVAVDLGPGAALAVTGPTARSFVSALVTQLAVWVGPADWRLVVVADDPGAWDWCRWLPHAVHGDASLVVAADEPDRMAATLSTLDDGYERHVVVVTDRPDLLARRTGPLRRFLGTAGSVAVVVEVQPGDTVPALCRSIVEIGSLGGARWRPDTSVPTRGEPVHVAGLADPLAATVARALAALTDPEDPAAAANGLPGAVTLGSLWAGHTGSAIDDPIAIAAAWHSAGPDPAPTAVIGLTGDGIVEVDLARDGPHALVAGTTGSGKSELLRTLVVSLAARCSPDHLTFVLVDYKGGATFDACADLPHTVGVVTDLDDHLAERALVSLDAEIRRRERLLRAAGADHLADYRAVPGRPSLPRVVVVIDEFATLADELPEFLSSLVGIARRGRSMGVHLVLATQRPDGAVNDDIRSNTGLRMALRLQHASDARDVVGDDLPARFPRGTPGRVMMRLDEGDAVVFQAARSTGPPSPRRADRLHVVDRSHPAPAAGEVSDLSVLVQSIRNAAALSDLAAPHRPWLPPLPANVAAEGDVVGLLDVPAAQCQEALRWSPADGNLAIVGALGTGTTTALLTVVAAACAGVAPRDRHVYVIDGRGDERLDQLAGSAHCGGVVRPHERERTERMLRRLANELDERRAAGGPAGRPEIVLAVDGMPALRAVLDGPVDAGPYEQLTRVVAEGPAMGIACVLTAERPAALPPAVLASCAERWILHLDDPSEGVVCGVPAALVPAAQPGRAVVASSRLEAQIGVAAVPDGPVGRVEGGPAPIGELPARVRAGALPPSRAAVDGVSLVAGVAFDTLGPARLEVPDGEHVLVAGPARSGRTSALVRLARAWQQAHPDGRVAVRCPLARSALAGWPGAVGLADVPAGGPCLVVVDDAERVDDDDGVLARLVAERRPGLLVLAAGRPDALRTLYGHWTGVVRRSRIGILMSMCGDTDGDVLGELLPRHPPLPARPGLAWVVAAGRRTLTQLSLDDE